jgi:SAM-dependent methyltransferase
MKRFSDGSAGDADYSVIGEGYARIRQPDPRIARQFHAALGDARTVLNVGAGAGSYEPLDRLVTAVEPSASMRAERPAHLAEAIDATADRLPFDDNSFDASMASVTIHQWPDLERGLAEMRRVTTGPIVILTFDPVPPERWWLIDYVPSLFDVEARRMPHIDRVRRALGPSTEVRTVPVPADSSDGFGQAFFARPERLLEPDVRKAMSAWSFIDPRVVDEFEKTLRADLESGAWDANYGHFRSLDEFDGGLRLIIGHPESGSRD